MAFNTQQSKASQINSSSLGQLIKLRILVLSLGESQHYGWWKSQFLSSTGINFLDRIYPRTKFIAAVHSAMRSGEQLHDTGIGKGEVIHLFRLDAKTESEIEQTLKESAQEFSDHFIPILANKTKLIEELEILTNGKTAPKQIGPVYVEGNPRNQVELLAAFYLNGFRQNTPVFPYFGIN